MMIHLAGSTSRRARAWALLTLVALPIAFLGAFGVAVVAISRSLVPNIEEGVRIDLALWLVCFGALGMLGVLIAARLAFGRWLEVRAEHVAVAAVGIAVAIGVELTLHEWAEASIGFYDSDFVGWTAELSFSVVVLAIALFGLAVAPSGADTPPKLATRLAVVVVLFIVLSNLPVLKDGIGPNSWPLVTSIGLAGIYAIAAAIIASWSRPPG